MKKLIYGRAMRMTLTLLLIASMIIAALCFAFVAPKSAKAEESAVEYTYILGDASVTEAIDYSYDEASKTYKYKSHAMGFSAATAKSVELNGNGGKNLIKIKLASEWKVSKAIQFNQAVNILLDLNGFDIALESPQSLDCVLGIRDGAAVELVDTGSGTAGKIMGGNAESGAGVYVGNASKFTMSGGRIAGNSGKNGGGVMVSNSVFIMNGGEISDNAASGGGGGVYLDKGSEFTMNGGVITANTAQSGGGISASSNTEITINGGKITENSATAGGGGGINSGSGGSVTVHGGEISGNSATTHGGGINSAGIITVASGESNEVEINNNTAGNNGGGINSTGSIILSELTISNNISNLGGGIFWNSVNGEALLSDCVITGNNSKGQGGGIFVYSGSSKISVSGAVKIYSNTKGTEPNDTADNLCLREQSQIDVAGSLKNGAEKAEIHVNTIHVNRPAEIATDFAEYNSDADGIAEDPSGYFVPDNGNYAIILDSAGGVCFAQSGIQWAASYTGDKPENESAYGTAFTYGENSFTGISLKQNDVSVNGVVITRVDTGATISGDIANAGVYSAKATVKGVNNANIEVEFKIVIKPFLLASESGHISDVTVEMNLVGSDWSEQGGDYISDYLGNEKTKPSVAVKLNGADLVSGTDYTVVYAVGVNETDTLKETGEYTVLVKGIGNYGGVFALDEKFTIIPNEDKQYSAEWQYFDGKQWKNLSEANFIFGNTDYSKSVRVKLYESETEETRYVYARGVEEYNETATDCITKSLSVNIDKNGENKIFNGGEYGLTLSGVPNYKVADSDKTNSVNVGKYDLSAAKEEDITAAAELNANVFNGYAKTLKVFVSIALGDGNVVFGTDGAEYELVIGYGNDTVENILLGGEYLLSLRATGNNFTGTLSNFASVAVEKAANEVTLSGIGSWMFGMYSLRTNPIRAEVAYLHDGSLAGTEKKAVLYTVNDIDGNAPSDKLVNFTSVTDEVAAALNSLNIGVYTINASVDGTESYFGADDRIMFTIAKAVNSWKETPDIIGWVEGKFNADENKFVGAPSFGAATYTISDAAGNVIYDESRGIDNRAKMKAGAYILSATVEGTDNYDGLSGSFSIWVLKKQSMPWWGVMLIIIASLAVAAGVFVALWKAGIIDILTAKVSVAIRTRAATDAVIASVRANKVAEAAKVTVAKAKAKERAAERRAKMLAEKNLPPEQKVAALEAKAAIAAERAEKMRMRSEAIRAQAEQLKMQELAQAEAAATTDKDKE